MKISYNWLKDYIKTDLSPEQVAEILTSTGLETESVTQYESIRGGLKGVVTGQIIACINHPDASKLKVCTVDIGKPELLTVVCGAPNVSAGQNVAVACINAEIFPYGKDEALIIRAANIRGVVSEGMICAQDELGLGSDHDGIIVLDPAVEPGLPLSEHFGVYTDTIFEIGLTPNRTDAMSHFGVARDLAARLSLMNDKDVILTEPRIEKHLIAESKLPVSVQILNTSACKRYTGIVLTDVNVGPSPVWLKNRLEAIGIKPHNNVVDVTNYVLHETGHPLHAFDYDRISGGYVVVGNLPEGTPFITLDGVEHKLSGNDLMICDRVKPLCIAGIYGGLGSGVTEETRRVFLESAWFDPVSVRRSARRHGFNTDASFRFERGADPQITIFALQRAVSLLTETAGAKVCSEMTDNGEFSITPPVMEVFLRFDRLRILTGKTIGTDELIRILKLLDFKIKDKKADGLTLSVPTYRADVTREIDVIEEVMRIYGMNNIEIPESIPVSFPVFKARPDALLRERISAYLVDNGFFEVWNNSITASEFNKIKDAYKTAGFSQVRILNPLSQDLNAMRTTLLFGLLENARYNINRRIYSLNIFEFGTVYLQNTEAGNDAPVTDKYSEKHVLAMVFTGQTTAESWYHKQSDTGYYDVKAVIEKISGFAGCSVLSYQPCNYANEHYYEGIECGHEGSAIAFIGRVNDKLLRKMGLKQNVWYAEIDFPKLAGLSEKKTSVVKPLPKYPDVRRDLSFVIDKNITFKAIADVVVSVSPDLVRDVILFDAYEADNLPEGKKSYAIGMVLGDHEKTLEEHEIESVMKRLVEMLNKKLGAVLR